MPETLQLANPTPLTTLTEDEILFRDNIRQFAEDKVRPLAKEMDEKGVFEKDLHSSIFSIGTDGHRDSGAIWRQRSKFFEAILAVEEFSRVDASAGVVVDVQNTLVNNALMRWATEEQKKHYLPRWQPTPAAPTRSAKPVRVRTRSVCKLKPNSKAATMS